MLDMFLSRARFHRLIWTSPRAVLLSKLAMREAAFLDLCRENRIPAPPGPAWVKPATSNQHYRARLPKREVGENPFVFFAGDFTVEEQRTFLDEVLSEPLEELEAMTARFRKRLAKINEHDDPFRLHDAIESCAHALPLPANDEAAAEARRSEGRRLNLLNEIFLYAEALGGHCRYGGLDGRQHAIRIGHKHVSFMLGSIDHADRLRLEIVSLSKLAGIKLRWEDTGARTLENILPAVMVEMSVVAETICRTERDAWKSWSPIFADDRSPRALARR